MNNAASYTAADAVKELLSAWKKIEAAALAQFPKASEEELYQITKGAMEHALRPGQVGR